MIRLVTPTGGRVLGRSLLTAANVITVVASLTADWNDSHIFNDRWPAHARFHGVTALATAVTLSSLNIWSLWSDTNDGATTRFYAAAIPVAYWAPFFLPLWSLAPRSRIHRTLSHGRQACQLISSARQLPPNCSHRLVHRPP